MSLDPAAAAEAARLLVGARRDGRVLDALPPHCRPIDQEDGYRIQERHVAQLCATYRARRIGYKIGATSLAAQALLGVAAPFSGRLLSRFSHCSPARLAAGDSLLRCIEPEIAFRLGSDLPADGAPYDQAAVAAAVGAVLPAIEVVDSRFRDWTKVGVPSLIADQGTTGHWVYGAEYPGWRDLDLAALAVRLVVNGEPCRAGSGANVLGHPLAALTWLANDLAARGRSLLEGELVSTGTCTEVYFARPGDHVLADFGPLLGAAAVTFGSDEG